MEPQCKFCDIGSGVGSVSIELAKAHPHLKLTLHDQPQIVEQARGVRSDYHSRTSLVTYDPTDWFPLQLWSQECPKALDEQRVDFVPLDFLKEGPAKNQDIYYVSVYFSNPELHNDPLSVTRCDISCTIGQMIWLLVYLKILGVR